MQHLISFLKNVEHIAFELYNSCSNYFKEDHQFAKFLSKVADDEALHYHFMASASDTLSQLDHEINSEIKLDDDTKRRILAPLEECKKLLDEKVIDKDSFLIKLIESEYSEWNDIFVYVVDTLKKELPVFHYAASRIQAHQSFMRKYIEVHEKKEKILSILNQAPVIWEKKLLIVDDDPMLRDLLSSVFKNECIVEVASNGKIALNLLRSSYYDMVLSDIDMPEMNGIELYEEILKLKTEQQKVFSLMSGRVEQEREVFIKANDIKLFRKPFSIIDIRNTIKEIMDK